MPLLSRPRPRSAAAANSFHNVRVRCIIEEWKLPMYLDLLHKTSLGAVTPGSRPFAIPEQDLRAIAQKQREVAGRSRRYRRSPEKALAVDMSAPHWQLPLVQVCLGLPSSQAEVSAADPENELDKRFDTQVDSIAIPVTSSLAGGKATIRDNHRAPALRPSSVCLSYVQTPAGDIPSAAVEDWDWLRARLQQDGADADDGIWCDKLPLAGGAGWWAKKAPLLYATQPVLLSPPSTADGYGNKMLPRNSTEELWYGALKSTDEHVSSCANCAREFHVMLKSLLRVLAEAACSHPQRGWAGDMLARSDPDAIVEKLFSADMVTPAWRNRLWPRMEATVALQARGAVLSPRGFYSAAKLVLMQSFVFAWALTEYGTIESEMVQLQEGVVGMSKFWEPALFVFRKCWANDRFDKGVWSAVMGDYRSESSSYERGLVTRAIATDPDGLAMQYGLQFLSEQESLNDANMFCGAGGLFRKQEDSIGPLSLRVTVMELLRVPVGPGDVFDPADIILWKREVNSLALPVPDAAPELVLSDETERYCIGIRPYDHCAIGEHAGPHLELAWSRYCSQKMLIPSAEAWRLNQELLEKAEVVSHYYKATFDLAVSELWSDVYNTAGPVCPQHAFLSYEKVGFSVMWPCVDMPSGERGRKLWFCSINEELKTAHLDCIAWVLESCSVGGADDALFVHSSSEDTSSDWHRNRGTRCSQCNEILGTWMAFSDGVGAPVAAYSSGIGSLPIWLPYRLQ